jgi:hypothetical protein
MNILNFTVITVMFFAIATLVWGIASMAHGGTYDREHSEKIMFTRIGVQAVAFAIILLALVFSYY